MLTIGTCLKPGRPIERSDARSVRCLRELFLSARQWTRRIKRPASRKPSRTPLLRELPSLLAVEPGTLDMGESAALTNPHLTLPMHLHETRSSAGAGQSAVCVRDARPSHHRVCHRRRAMVVYSCPDPRRSVELDPHLLSSITSIRASRHPSGRDPHIASAAGLV